MVVADPFRDFFARERNLDNDKRDFLKSRGWEHTSTTPGSFWMFQKALADGRIMLTTMEHALTVEALTQNQKDAK